MSEMRNKLLDIQNNKQYIEQKILEYERKLVQLKGTNSNALISNYQIPPQQAYYYGSNEGTFTTRPQMGKSSSGMIVINNNHLQPSRR